MNFASDNVYGVHPAIMQAMVDANTGTALSYCYDSGSKEVEARLSEVFEKEVKVFQVTNGTAANGLALSALVPPFGAILCHAEAHICIDECGSPELLTGGAKLIGHHGANGKITPDLIAKTLGNFVRSEHDPKPAAVSITNSTELGTVYKPDEIKAIADLAHGRKMKLHMDGARFANALVSADCTPAELTWKSGVDAMSFGGTKNGGMFLEAVIFFNTALAEDFLYRRMRGGQLMSKSRYLAAQMLAYLKDGLWLDNARRANALAQKLSMGLKQFPKLRLTFPTEANEVFVMMPRKLYDGLHHAGAHFHEWPIDGVGEDEVHVRFVLSWATPDEHIDRFVKLAQEKL